MRASIFTFNKPNLILKFFVIIITLFLVNIAFACDIYAASPEELNCAKDMVNYCQDQVYSIQQQMLEQGLNRDVSQLSVEEQVLKKEYSDALKDSISSLKHHLSELDKIKPDLHNPSELSVKREGDNFGEGSSRKR